MFPRPKNRRRPSEARARLPAINWRSLGLWVLALAGIAAAGGAVSWAFDQPIETVAGEGRFQRVAPVDVERVVKERSEEHTSELQSQSNLVCRLLLEKKKQRPHINDGRR